MLLIKPTYYLELEKNRMTFWSCGSFLADKISNKTLISTKNHLFLPYATAFKFFA